MYHDFKAVVHVKGWKSGAKNISHKVTLRQISCFWFTVQCGLWNKNLTCSYALDGQDGRQLICLPLTYDLPHPDQHKSTFENPRSDVDAIAFMTYNKSKRTQWINMMFNLGILAWRHPLPNVEPDKSAFKGGVIIFLSFYIFLWI